MTRWLAILALAAGCSTHREESRQADVRATAALVAEADTRTVAERGPVTTVIEEFATAPADADRAPPADPPRGSEVAPATTPGLEPVRLRLTRRTTITQAPIGAAPAERVTTEGHAELAADAGVTTHTEARMERDVRPGLGFSLTFVAAAAVGLVLAGAAARWAWRRYGPPG